MIVTLIPMFLAASIGVKENAWKYGPEMIYDVAIGSVSHPPGRIDETSSLNITMKLNCRPAGRSSLVCRFTEPNVTSTRAKNSGEIQTEKEICNDANFELKFGNDGIKEVVVPAEIKEWKLEMLRVLVAQMAVRANFSSDDSKNANKPLKQNCGTRYVFASPDTSGKQKSKPYEIMIVQGGKLLRGEKKEIRMTADIKRCHYGVNYFFGHQWRQRAQRMYSKLISADSHMIIGAKEWIAWYEGTIVVSSKPRSSGFTIVQRVTLSLNNIVPATGPLPTIDRPSTVDFFPDLWFPSDEYERIDTSEETNNFD